MQWLADLLLSFLKHLKDKSLHHSPFAYRIKAKFLTGRQGAMLSLRPYLPLGSSLTPLFYTGMSVPSPPTRRLTPNAQPSICCSHDLECPVFPFVPTRTCVTQDTAQPSLSHKVLLHETLQSLPVSLHPRLLTPVTHWGTAQTQRSPDH